MTTDAPEARIVTAAREIAAAPISDFEFIVDPTRQPSWDGNDNLAAAAPGQTVRAVGDIFGITLTMGSVRHYHVVEFEEGRRIAWRRTQARSISNAGSASSRCSGSRARGAGPALVPESRVERWTGVFDGGDPPGSMP